MDSGVLVYGDVTFDTVGWVVEMSLPRHEFAMCSKKILCPFSLEAGFINSTEAAAGAVTEGYEPWQKTLIGASAGALSLVTIAGNLMVS